MRLSVLVPLLVALALVVLLLLTADPFHLLGSGEERGGSPDLLDDGPLGAAHDATLVGRAGGPGTRAVHLEDAPLGVVDLGLGTGTLHGVVRGEGEPLEGARVRAVLPGHPEARAVRTDADGTWRVRGLPAGSFELRATHPDFLGRTVTAPPLAEAAEAAVETIDLARRRPDTDGFEVLVRDEWGRPVPGAKVLATTMLWSVHLSLGPELSGAEDVLSKRGVTDEQGRARLAPLPPETYDVVVLASGYAVESQPSIVLSEGVIKHVSFRLKPGATISGTVVDAEGKPVGQAYVIGLHMPSFAPSPSVMTGDDGTFALDGLREGSYWVIAGAEGHGDGSVRPVASPSTGVRVQLGGSGFVELTVVDAERRPVTSYHVRPFRDEPFGYTYSPRYEVRDPAGRHRLPLSPGTWKLSIQDDAGNLSEEAQVTVEVGATVETTVVLPRTAVLAGTVVDAEGNHVPDAEVFVKRGGMPAEPKREQYARTDAEGAFTLRGLPPGVVNLHVRHPRHAPAVFEVDLTATDAAKEERTFTLPPTAVIEGTVRRGDAPVPALQVNCMLGMNWFEPVSTVTDENGHFHFEGLGMGGYTLTTGVFEMQSSGARKSCTVSSPGAVVTVDFELAADAAGVVEGTVTRGGQPLAGAYVSVYDARDVETAVQSDANGSWRAQGVTPGDVVVRALLDDGVSLTRRLTVPSDGTPARIDLAFGAAGVTGRLLSATEDLPISGAWIQIEALDEAGGPGRVRGTSSSDPEGVFRVLGLGAGRYRLRVSGSGHAALVTDPFTVAETGLVDLGTYRLATGVALQGTVRDDAGKPVESATIALQDASGRPVFLFSLVTTGSDGRYAASGLEPGRYVVRFEARGYAPDEHPVDVGPGGATVDGVLRRGGAVAVEVVDEGGLPVPAARLVLRDALGEQVRRTLSLANLDDGTRTLTNESGLCVVPDLAPGTYTVSATREGFLAPPSPLSVRVESGAESTLRVVLQGE